MRQNTTTVAPNLILREVEPGQINARNAILTKLQNDQRTYINQVSISATITKKNSKEPVYQVEKEKMQVAPNSNFSFPISLNKKALKPGNYRLSMSIYGNKSEKGAFAKEKDPKTKYENHWTFKKDFRIDPQVADDLNQKDVTLKQDNTWLYLLIGLIVLVVFGWCIYILWRKRRQNN